jgi:protocadherin-16/23
MRREGSTENRKFLQKTCRALHGVGINESEWRGPCELGFGVFRSVAGNVTEPLLQPRPRDVALAGFHGHTSRAAFASTPRKAAIGSNAQIFDGVPSLTIFIWGLLFVHCHHLEMLLMVVFYIIGKITAKEPLDREQKDTYDLVAEARDQGIPSRSVRVVVKIYVLDVNDNAPEIIDPQEDVVSVREEQPPGTEVVRVRAVDADNGQNASITYLILKGRDSDGYGVFNIDPVSGVVRTRMTLDHEERTIYRLVVAASDAGTPPKQTVRMLRVEVLDLNDNRPTFTSSSLVFRVREDVKIGHVVGSVAASESVDQENIISTTTGGHITYTLTSLMPENIIDAFDIDHNTGSLVVARQLDREKESEYRLEIRALDTSAMNNPQSSAITVRIDIADANDNSPRWPGDLVTISLNEDTEVGTSIYNFTASDSDYGNNGDIRYHLLHQYPNNNTFTIDSLTGTLTLTTGVDYEAIEEYIIVVAATDQSLNVSDRRTSSVTARLVVTDFNDNPPKFVVPVPAMVFIGDVGIVGMKLAHVVAVDNDSGDNGRVTYVISGGNEGGLFAMGYDTGVLTLAKPLPDAQKTYVLNITATDHGTPTLHADMELKLTVQGSETNPPRFFNSLYTASVPEDAPVGTFVTKVTAKSGLVEEGMYDLITETMEIWTCRCASNAYCRNH